MITMSDDQLAALYMRQRPLPDPGEYSAPCATARWDGATLNVTKTGTAPDAAVLVRWPRFARLFAPPPVVAAEPTISALEADYGAATTGLLGVAAQGAFAERLVDCRACEAWEEAGRGGRGYCDSIKAACACRRLWRADERCPKGKWPA